MKSTSGVIGIMLLVFAASHAEDTVVEPFSESFSASFEAVKTPAKSAFPTYARVSSVTPLIGNVIQEPTSELVDTHTAASQKHGMIFGIGFKAEWAEPFMHVTSWGYNYGNHPHYLYGVTRAWKSTAAVGHTELLNKHEKEFVPMAGYRHFLQYDSSAKFEFQKWKQCWMKTEAGPADRYDKQPKWPDCDAQSMVSAMKEVQKLLKKPMQYLLSANEPWNTIQNISPEEAVEMHRKYLQPAAKGAKLKLVSASVGWGEPHWLGEFLVLCYSARDDSNFPCDVESLYDIAVHDYQCRESFWRNIYNSETGDFPTKVVAYVKDFYPEYDWAKWMKARKLWVTETNCNWDILYPHWDPRVKPDNNLQCRRAAGLETGFGQGSIKTMNDMPEIRRYSWWTFYRPDYANPTEEQLRAFNSRMVGDDGALRGPGKAILAINTGKSASTLESQCPAPPPPPPPPPPPRPKDHCKGFCPRGAKKKGWTWKKVCKIFRKKCRKCSECVNLASHS